MPNVGTETSAIVDFKPVGLPLDVAAERKNWDAAFAQLMTARRFGEMDAAQAAAFINDFVECGITAEELIEPLEAAIAVVAGAKAFLEGGLARMLLAGQMVDGQAAIARV